MAVLVFAEHIDGIFHKPAFEAVTYAYDLAQKMGTSVCAIAAGNIADDELKKLGQYGVNKVYLVKGDNFTSFDARNYATALEAAINQSGADVIIMSSTFNGKSLAPRLAARIKAGLISNAVGLPETAQGFVIKKPVYSGKGFGHFNITTDKKIISIAINSHHLEQHPVEAAIENLNVDISGDGIKVLETHRQKGKISLPEAEVVVSGGRGMKGPDNWHLIEELADVLGAATACSKPVSDVG